MSRLTLRLPETLHQQLVNLAEGEGISLNQCIVDELTRQIASAYTVQVISEADRQQQQKNTNIVEIYLAMLTNPSLTHKLAQNHVD